MRWLMLAGGAVAAVALAQANRLIVEDGVQADAGVFTASAYPTFVRGQTSARLWPATCSSNTCTRAAPTYAEEGMELGGIHGWVVTACLDAGTFVDGGTIEIWARNPDAFAGQAWGKVQGADLTPDNNQTCTTFQARENDFGTGNWRMVTRANGIKTSQAAPKMNVQIHGCLKQGCAP